LEIFPRSEWGKGEEFGGQNLGGERGWGVKRGVSPKGFCGTCFRNAVFGPPGARGKRGEIIWGGGNKEGGEPPTGGYIGGGVKGRRDIII